MPAWKQERTARRRSTSTPPWPTGSACRRCASSSRTSRFAAMHPKRYAEIDHMVSTRSPERDLYLTQVLEQVRERLAELRINAEVTGRPKHL